MGLSLKKLGSKIFDQVNPFDNGRTYQQRTPTTNRSVGQQLSNNVQGVNRQVVQPALNQASRAATMVSETPVGRVFGIPSQSQGIEDIAKRYSPDVANQIRYKGYSDLLKQSGIGINDSKATIGRKAVSDIAGTASNFIPVGMTAKAVTSGVKPALGAIVRAGNKSGLATALSTGLATAHDTTDVKKIAQSAAQGYGVGFALPVGGTALNQGAKAVARAAKDVKVPQMNLTPLNEAGGIKINNPLGAKAGLLINNPDGAKYGGLKVNNPDNAQVKPIKVSNPMGAKTKTELKINNKNTPVVSDNLSGAAQQSRLSKLGLKPLDQRGSVQIPSIRKQSPADLTVSSPKNTRVPLEVTNKNTLMGEFQQGLVDKDAPVIHYLKQVEKDTGQTGLVDQFVYDTGLQRRSTAVANAMMQGSENLNKAFKGLAGKEKANFDSYVAAKQELANANNGLPTSAPVTDLQAVVKAGSQHEARFQALNKYYKEWSDRLHQAGIIDDATHKSFNANNDYTRVQRVMDDLANYRGQGGNSYSLGSTLTRLKRKGSKREIQPADLTAFKYGQDVQSEIQRNQTASNLIDVLESQGHAKRVDSSTSKNTLSRIVNGEKQIYEVPRDIKQIADNVSPYQLGILSRIVAAPQRLLRAGATGLSLPFTAANYVKDQVSSAAMSKDVMATHAPQNIFSGLYQAAKDFGVTTDDALWQKFQAHLGDTTQYDFIRNAKNAKQLSREIRLGQGGRYANRTINPIRTLEDLNQITEKATRFQNFKGTYKQALKDGLSETEATQKATLAAWQNSVDFSRMGHVGQALNLLIPYFNAGIQGTRLLGRRVGEAPAATSAKIIGFVGLPLAGVTFYNLEDEQRRKVYDNISDFEKQNNIVIVLPGAKQNQDGSYSGVIKIPLQPGMSNTVQPIRQSIENYAHGNPQDVAAMSKQFFGAMAGPVNTNSVSAAAGSLTPQVVKPFVQQVANKDLFTGKQIVPDYINNATDANGNPVQEKQKAYPYTSGTARLIGNATNQSPIRVEKFIKDASAKVGMYSINASDNALAKAGAIPKEQIGGVSAKEDLARRFTIAQGKVNYKKSAGAKYYDNIKKVTAKLSGNEQAAFNALHPAKKNFLGDTIYTADKVYDPAARLDVYNRYPKVFEADKKLDAQNKIHNPLFALEPWQVKKVLEKDNLPPGAKDPELSKLYDQPWYADYAAKKSAYFTASKAATEKAGKTFGKNDNPYPVTDAGLQKAMDTYSSLPKGTGARSNWIKSNPGAWNAMQNQFALIDSWQNVQRGKRGLDLTEGDTGKASGYGDSTKTYSSSGGSGSSGSSDPYKYAVSLNQGSVGKPKAFKVSKSKAVTKKKIGKIKTKSVKSKV